MDNFLQGNWSLNYPTLIFNCPNLEAKYRQRIDKFLQLHTIPKYILIGITIACIMNLIYEIFWTMDFPDLHAVSHTLLLLATIILTGIALEFLVSKSEKWHAYRFMPLSLVINILILYLSFQDFTTKIPFPVFSIL